MNAPPAVNALTAAANAPSPSSGAREELEIARSLAVAALGRRTRIADRMVHEIATDVREYLGAADSASVLADVREHCDAQVQTFLASFVDGVSPETLDLSFAYEACTRRVRQGVPLTAILHSFRIGQRVTWTAVLHEAELVPSGRTAAVLLVEPSLRYIDTMSTLLAEIYLREQQKLLAVADRVRRDVLELLLTGAPNALQAAHAAGISLDPEATHHVISATIGAGEDMHGLQALEEALTKAFERDLVLMVVRQRGLTALVRGRGERSGERATQALRSATTTAAVGIGLPVQGLKGLGPAHEQARIALRMVSASRPVVTLADTPVLDYLLAGADSVAQSMVSDSVRALAWSKRPADRALVHTLELYLRSGLNVAQTAAQLPAHPNTVHHRLRRLAEKTGCSTHDADQLLQLSIELRLASDSGQRDL